MSDILLKRAKFLVKSTDGTPVTVVIELRNIDNDFVVLKHFGDPDTDSFYTTDRIDNYGPEDDEKADMHFIYHCMYYCRRWL